MEDVRAVREDLAEVREDVGEVRSAVAGLSATLTEVRHGIVSALETLRSETQRLQERYHGLAGQEQAVASLKASAKDHEERMRTLELGTVFRPEIETLKLAVAALQLAMAGQAGVWLWVRNVGAAATTLGIIMGGLWWLFQSLPHHP